MTKSTLVLPTPLAVSARYTAIRLVTLGIMIAIQRFF